jgi:DNA mismatch endonuclease (patch repair protein)
MSRVRHKDTVPELKVRRLVHSLGFRYRLHVRDLPGRPDLVFPARKAVIFIHGCFWHRHSCAAGDRIPKSRVNFWRAKLEGNASRDRRAVRKLRRTGWRVLILWECHLTDGEKLRVKLLRFLDQHR